MSETNEKGKGVKNFLKRVFSRKDKNPKNNFQLSIASAPKRKTKKKAPQPPMELTSISTISEPSHSQQNYATSVDDIEKGISELTLSDHNSNLQQVSLAQVHIASDLTNSKAKKIKVEHTKSSMTQKESNAVLKIKEIVNSNEKLNAIENCQIQKSLDNKDIKNTKSENFATRKSSNLVALEIQLAEVENELAILNLQTNSKNNKPTFEIKSPNIEQTNIIAENNSSQILENETYQIETTKCNIRNEDEPNRSLKEEIKNKNEGDNTALEEIESVMHEVKSLKLEMQKLNNNSDSFFEIEMGLTNAIIKLDGIQMPKNELLKKKRKEGIILIHEIFKQLDEQGKLNQT